MKACDYCHEERDTVRTRRTPDGDMPTLCRECWLDVQGAWTTTRES